MLTPQLLVSGNKRVVSYRSNTLFGVMSVSPGPRRSILQVVVPTAHSTSYFISHALKIIMKGERNHFDQNPPLE